MLSQVAKLFLLHNWFTIIDLWSVSLLETLPLVKLKHQKIVSISSCDLVSVLAMQCILLWFASRR